MADKEYPEPEANPCGGYYCSEEHGHIDCVDKLQMSCCQTPGLTTDEPVVTEIHSCMGQHYFKAVAQIGSIFGYEVDGEISAIGTTREQALEHLAKERQKLFESLWA